MIKFGVIGTNWITEMFIEAAYQTSEYQLTTVYSRTEERAQTFIEQLKVSHDTITTATTISDLLASDIDLVYIASPNALHYEQAKAVITAGKHVIVEKPVASNPAEFADLQTALAQHPDVLLFEAARHIHQPNFKKIKEMMKTLPMLQGATLVYQKYSSRFDAYLAGQEPNVLTRKFSAGALYDLGVYPLYAALDLFGTPQAVQYIPTLLRNGADGKGTAILVYPDYTVTLLFGKSANSYLPSEIYGQKETISISNITELESVTYHDGNGHQKEISTPVDDNPMIHEAQDFANIIKDPNGQREVYNNWFRLSQQVNQTLFDLRQSAGIEFPADKRE